jgi:hypothetical protein
MKTEQPTVTERRILLSKYGITLTLSHHKESYTSSTVFLSSSHRPLLPLPVLFHYCLEDLGWFAVVS